MGLKDQILAAEDLPSENVDVPEWGVTVQVKGMTGSDRDAYEAKGVSFKKGGQDVEVQLADFRIRLLVKCLYDPESGERLFSDNEVKQLGSKSGVILERLYEVASRLSGMSDDGVAASRGNSKTGRSAGSTTA